MSFYDGKWGYEQWEGSFVDDKPHGEGVMVVREGGARVPFAFERGEPVHVQRE